MKFFPLVLPLFVVSIASAQLVTDDFGSGNRTNWFNNAETADISVNAGAGTLTFSDTFNNSVANSGVTWNFATDASEFALAIGETLSASFELRFDGGTPPSVANGFRVGFLNMTDAQKVSADDHDDIANGTGYGGYAFRINPGATTSNAEISQRTGSGNIMVRDSSQYTLIDNTNNNSVAIGADTFIPVSFALSRTAASTMLLEYNFNGATGSATDSSGIVSSFDVMDIWFSSSLTGPDSASLRNVSVAVIPEPSTFTLLAGLGAFWLVSMGRRIRK